MFLHPGQLLCNGLVALLFRWQDFLLWFVLVVVLVVLFCRVESVDGLLSLVFGDFAPVFVDSRFVVEVGIGPYASKARVKLGLVVLLGGESELGVAPKVGESSIVWERLSACYLQ